MQQRLGHPDHDGLRLEVQRSVQPRDGAPEQQFPVRILEADRDVLGRRRADVVDDDLEPVGRLVVEDVAIADGQVGQ